MSGCNECEYWGVVGRACRQLWAFAVIVSGQNSIEAVFVIAAQKAEDKESDKRRGREGRHRKWIEITRGECDE
jgi:hypothetical protein